MVKPRAGPSTSWLKAKCYSIDEYELLGVEGEAGKPNFALMADRPAGRYVGTAFVSQSVRKRLWQRAQEHVGPPPEGMKRPATLWVKPGIIVRAKHLRGRDDLRHASVLSFRDESNQG